MQSGQIVLGLFPVGKARRQMPGRRLRREKTGNQRKEQGDRHRENERIDILERRSRAERRHTEEGFAQPQRFGDFLEDEKEDDDADRQATEERGYNPISSAGFD